VCIIFRDARALSPVISFTSCRAGPGGAAKSCDALLTRVEQNDATLQELVILSNKTFGATEVERLAAALGKLRFLAVPACDE
jgi:hypothetical protein